MEKLEIISKKVEGIVTSYKSTVSFGFEKALLLSKAVNSLQEELSDEYMQNIMKLQSSKLGFLTDKDKDKGYSVEIVRRCLIHAVLMGLYPIGNQFNIIAGQMYPTKEGLGFLLNQKGLDYRIICEISKMEIGKPSALVLTTIKWIDKGVSKEETIQIPVKQDGYTTVDSLIGKATRKARAWLLGTITGEEISDGDAHDATVTNVPYTTIGSEQLITLEQLETLFEKKGTKLSEPEIDRANEIIKNKEVAAYKKLYTRLEAII